MENPEYISLKRDIVLCSLIETEEDSTASEYIDFIQEIIDRSTLMEKDGAKLYTNKENPNDWYIFINDSSTVIHKSIDLHFSRRLVYMDSRHVADIINTIINMLLNIDNTIKVADPQFSEFYYYFFYDNKITTTNSKIKLKMLDCYSTTTD